MKNDIAFCWAPTLAVAATAIRTEPAIASFAFIFMGFSITPKRTLLRLRGPRQANARRISTNNPAGRIFPQNWRNFWRCRSAETIDAKAGYIVRRRAVDCEIGRDLAKDRGELESVPGAG